MDKDRCYKVAKRMTDLYCLYFKAWVCISDPNVTAVPFNTIKSQFDIKHVMKHLHGNYAIGVFAGENATKFVSIDIDEGDRETVRKVIDTLVGIGIPEDRLYVSYSGKKGYHVDFFVENYIYNDSARILYEEMIERSGLNRRKVEFRPTHGQAIKLPLGVHQTTKNRCWFVDPVTLEQIEDFDYIFGIQKIKQEYLEEIAKRLKNERVTRMYAEMREKRSNVQKAKPASYDSLVVTAPGTRHNIQKKVAARARMDGCDYDEIVARQLEWCREQNQAYIMSSEKEIRDDAEKLARWAVANVTIKPIKNTNGEAIVATVGKQCLPYILGAPTKTARMVLFLLCIYCGKYGDVKVAHRTLADHIGISAESVKNAIKWGEENGYISVEHSLNKYNGFLLLKSANKYKFPGDKKLATPRKIHLLGESYEVREWPTAENFYDMYIDMLTSLCKIEYLERFLTKPELKACKERVMRIAGESTSDDADGSA